MRSSQGVCVELKLGHVSGEMTDLRLIHVRLQSFQQDNLLISIRGTGGGDEDSEKKQKETRKPTEMTKAG